jgi:hypothetical protein
MRKTILVWSTLFFLIGSGVGLAGDEIPEEVLVAWRDLPRIYAHAGVMKIVQSTLLDDRDVWDVTAKRLGDYLLADVRMYGGPISRNVRGPTHSFVIEGFDGPKNCVAIVPSGTAFPGDAGEVIKGIESWMHVPCAICGVPLPEFFERCSVLAVRGFRTNTLEIDFSMTDHETEKIMAPGFRGYSGTARFDATNGYRFVGCRDTVVNRKGQSIGQESRVLYDQAKPSNFVWEVGSIDLSKIHLRTVVIACDDVVDPKEFLPETYAIFPSTTTIQWWQRPMLWIALFAVGCFAAAAVLRRRSTTRDTQF